MIYNWRYLPSPPVSVLTKPLTSSRIRKLIDKKLNDAIQSMNEVLDRALFGPKGVDHYTVNGPWHLVKEAARRLCENA